MTLQVRPCFNLLAASAPLLGVVSAIAAVLLEDYLFHEHPAHYIKTAGMTFGFFLLFGFVSACIALVRRERWWGLTALGLILNAPFLLIVWWAPWDMPF